MWCEKCGRLTLFKRTCASCAREQQRIRALEGAAGPDLSTPNPQVRTRTVVHSNLKARLNGQDVTFDLSKGLTDEILDDVAGRLRLSRDRARQILEPQLSPDRIAALTKAALEGKAAPSATTVSCPTCHHQVLAGPACSHCGASLPG
jgi:ribosomal protein L32